MIDLLKTKIDFPDKITSFLSREIADAPLLDIAATKAVPELNAVYKSASTWGNSINGMPSLAFVIGKFV